MKTLRFLASCSLAFATASFARSATESPVHEKAAAPLRIAHGSEVKLEDYLVSGKTTIFDFTSKYCPPCEAMSPRLDKLHAKRDDVAVVKVDINRPKTKGIDWSSPVAKEFGLESIPAFKVFGPDGKLVAEGTDARGMVEKWLD